MEHDTTLRFNKEQTTIFSYIQILSFDAPLWVPKGFIKDINQGQEEIANSIKNFCFKLPINDFKVVQFDYFILFQKYFVNRKFLKGSVNQKT